MQSEASRNWDKKHFAFFLLYILSEATMVSELVLVNVNFLEGKSFDDHHEHYDDLAVIGPCFLASMLFAIPTGITMVERWRAPHSCSGGGHHHGILHTLGDVILVGLPYAILTFAGGVGFTNESTDNEVAKGLLLSLSVVLGVVSGFGNFKMHTHQPVTWDSIKTRYTRAPNKTQLATLCLYDAAGILVGHLAEGLYVASVIATLLHHNNSLWANLPLWLFFGAGLLAGEGRTEVLPAWDKRLPAEPQEPQSSDAPLLDQASLKTCVRKLLACYAALSGFSHALVNSTSFIAMTQIWFNTESFDTSKRLLLFALTNLSLVYPNARGFYHLVLEPCQKAFARVSCLTVADVGASGDRSSARGPAYGGVGGGDTAV